MSTVCPARRPALVTSMRQAVRWDRANAAASCGIGVADVEHVGDRGREPSGVGAGVVLADHAAGRRRRG